MRDVQAITSIYSVLFATLEYIQSVITLYFIGAMAIATELGQEGSTRGRGGKKGQPVGLAIGQAMDGWMAWGIHVQITLFKVDGIPHEKPLIIAGLDHHHTKPTAIMIMIIRSI